MKYKLENHWEVTAAKSYLASLIEKKCLIEIKQVRPQRSLAQNRYLHRTFSIFAAQYHCLPHEAKQIYKRYANPDLYVYEKNGMEFLRSSAVLTTSEMNKSLDNWRLFAAENDIHIPLPHEEEALRYWDNVIETQNNM